MKTESEWLDEIERAPKGAEWLRTLRARLNRIPASALKLGAHELRYRDRAGTVRDVKTAYDALMHIGERLSYAEATARLCVLFPGVAEGREDVSEPQAMSVLPLDDQRILRAVRVMFAAIGDRRVRILAIDPDEPRDNKAGRHLFPKGSNVNAWNYDDVVRTLNTLKYFNRAGFGIYAMPHVDADYAVIVVDDVANPGLVAEVNGRRIGRTKAAAEKYVEFSRPNLYFRTSPEKTQAIFFVDEYDLHNPDVRAILLETAQEENIWHGDPGVNNLVHAFRVPGFMNTKNKYRTRGDDGRLLQPIVRIEGEPHTGMSDYVRFRIGETRREPASGLERGPSPRIWPGPEPEDAELVGRWLRAVDPTFGRATDGDMLELAERLASRQPEQWQASVSEARAWAVSERVRAVKKDAGDVGVEVDASLKISTRAEANLDPDPSSVQESATESEMEWTWNRAKAVASAAQTPEDALPAVAAFGMALGVVQLRLRTEAICKAAVENAAAALRFVPVALRTPELCSVAVERDAMLLSCEDYDCGAGADVIGPRPAGAVRKRLIPPEMTDAVLTELFLRNGARSPYTFLQAQARAEGIARADRLSPVRVWTVAVRCGASTLADTPPDADLRAEVEAAIRADAETEDDGQGGPRQ